MDSLSFEKYSLSLDHLEQSYICARIIINGRSLIDIVREYELPFARKCDQEEIAGSYMPMYADYLHALLTNRKKSEEYDSEIPILICQCGNEGCWDLLVTVSKEAETVVWSNIHNPYRSSPSRPGGFWNYSGFPAFVFDKGEYKAALESLAKMLE